MQSEGSRSSYFILLLSLFTALVTLLLLRDRVPPSWLSCLQSSASAKDDPLAASSTSASTAPGRKSVAAALDSDINASLGVSRRQEQLGEDAATGFDVWMQENDAADEAEAADHALELATLGNSAAPPKQQQQQPQPDELPQPEEQPQPPPSLLVPVELERLKLWMIPVPLLLPPSLLLPSWRRLLVSWFQRICSHPLDSSPLSGERDEQDLRPRSAPALAEYFS